jgi:CBS domain containing-hemolysin-like protein
VSVPTIGLGVLAVVLAMSAGALAAGEAALGRVSRTRAGELLAEGRRGSLALSTVAADPAPILSVATFLRALAEAGAVAGATVVLAQRFDVWWHVVGVTALIVGAVLFVVVGVGPRTLGRHYAERVGLVSAPLLLALSRVLGPLTRVLVLIANALTPGPGFRDGPFGSEAELRELVDLAQETQVIEAGEREMIHSVFELGDTLVREVMVPRTEVVSVVRGTTLGTAMSLFLRSGFSRVPVVGEGLDDVLGMLYLKDVARRIHEGDGDIRQQPVESAMRDARFVPDSKPVDDLLREMQRDGGHLAVVVDEYGGTAGLVTLEDIVEEVIGDISDEYDPEEVQDVQPLEQGRFRVRARLHVDKLGDLFGLDLQDDDVETVGGLLAKSLGRVPIAGASAEVAGLVLTADGFTGRRNQLATLVVSRAGNAGRDDDT